MSASKQQIQAAFSALRKMIDDTGWGSWVSDDKLMSGSVTVANAVVAAVPRQPTPVAVPASQPAEQAPQ